MQRVRADRRLTTTGKLRFRVSHLLGSCFSQITFLSIFQLACRPYSSLTLSNPEHFRNWFAHCCYCTSQLCNPLYVLIFTSIAYKDAQDAYKDAQRL